MPITGWKWDGNSDGLMVRAYDRDQDDKYYVRVPYSVLTFFTCMIESK